MRYEIKAAIVASVLVGGFYAVGMTLGYINRTDFENQPTHTGWFEVLSFEHQKLLRVVVRSTGDSNAPTYAISFTCNGQEIIVRKGGVYPLDYKVVGAEGRNTLRFINYTQVFCGK